MLAWPVRPRVYVATVPVGDEHGHKAVATQRFPVLNVRGSDCPGSLPATVRTLPPGDQEPPPPAATP